MKLWCDKCNTRIKDVEIREKNGVIKIWVKCHDEMAGATATEFEDIHFFEKDEPEDARECLRLDHEHVYGRCVVCGIKSGFKADSRGKMEDDMVREANKAKDACYQKGWRDGQDRLMVDGQIWGKSINDQIRESVLNAKIKYLRNDNSEMEKDRDLAREEIASAMEDRDLWKRTAKDLRREWDTLKQDKTRLKANAVVFMKERDVLQVRLNLLQQEQFNTLEGMEDQKEQADIPLLTWTKDKPTGINKGE
ncbi:hypothetical protein LCGC14_2182700, partial [marine sediment metagenome]